METISKKELENLLGFRISEFAVKPKFDESNVFIGLDILVVKEQTLESFETKITIVRENNE